MYPIYIKIQISKLRCYNKNERSVSMNIFSTIVATGIPGFLSYIYLNQLGILNYSKNEKDEKITVLAIFSFLNMGISFYAFYGITGINPTKKLEIISIAPLFFISLLISSIMTFAVYPFVLKKMDISLKKFQEKNKIAKRSSKTLYELTMFKKDHNPPFIYIFDFEDNFIESGYFYRLYDINDKLQLSLSTNTYHTKEKFSIDEVLEQFNKLENSPDKADLIIDVDHKIKIFVFYY